MDASWFTSGLQGMANPLGVVGSELFALMANNPDAAAEVLAAQGVPPPAPGVGPDTSMATDPATTSVPKAPQGDVGGALTAPGPGGYPSPFNPKGYQAAEAGAAQPSALANAMNGIMGVAAPKPPQVPDVSTPSVSPPSPAAPSGGNINIGQGLAGLVDLVAPKPPQLPPYELPSTLARALLGRA